MKQIRQISQILLAFGLAGLAGSLHAEDFQGAAHVQAYDDPPINYSAQTPKDPVARLQARIERGEVKLKWDEKYGWLPAMLDALKVPESSQMLVFSQTSLQRREINPRNPRALYYSDEVYLGYIPHAPLMEISAVDPQLGAIFYALDQNAHDKPTFTRSSECLQCHVSGRSLGVPGHFVRSLRTDGSGEVLSGTDIGDVTHCTPLADRWGGWYVTGQHGSQAHLGNLVGASAFDRHSGEPGFRGNVSDLSALFDTAKYLRPQSDIVALMVLEHQSHMHNYITRLSYETRVMTQTYGHIRYLKNQVNGFLRYLLFAEEARLTAPISGDPRYVADFTAPSRRDSRGRSLRDLDLQTRLFKYPCSYLIYSDAFDQMPTAMRDHLLQRLYDILSGKDSDPQFAALGAADRQAVLEILRETKPNLPAYWDPAGTPRTGLDTTGTHRILSSASVP